MHSSDFILHDLGAYGTGASVMQRIAAPMIGGMVTSTVLTLVVIPVLYYLWRSRQIHYCTGGTSQPPERLIRVSGPARSGG